MINEERPLIPGFYTEDFSTDSQSCNANETIHVKSGNVVIVSPDYTLNDIFTFLI